MNLDEWCEQNPSGAAKLRERLGRKTLAKLRRNGSGLQSAGETFRAIAAETRHEVTANDFFGIDPRLAAKAVRRRRVRNAKR